jgi:hypothetical protein
MFKAATVTTREPYSREIGRALGDALVDKLEVTPNCCWLFCAAAPRLRDLLAGVNEAVSPSLVIGCTSESEISTHGFSTGSAVLGGVVTDEIDFHVALVEGISRDSEKAGTKLAERLPRDVRHVQVFSDGVTGNGCGILRGMTSALGKTVPISGGTAADAGRFHRTGQFLGSRLLSDGAVAVGLSGSFALGTGVRSGWSPIGIAKKVTRSEGNVVYELNGQPALEVYERFLGKHADKLPGVGVEYPFGLVERSGVLGENDYYLLRATMSVNRSNGSIAFAGEIPEGSLVRLTCGEYTSILNAAEEAARQAQDGLQGHSPVMVFVYSCMARRIVLGRRTKEELDRIRGVFGADLPIVGFYTFGEYCRVCCEGPSLFHNETATVSVIGLNS